jgi:hypothetical protein
MVKKDDENPSRFTYLGPTRGRARVTGRVTGGSRRVVRCVISAIHPASSLFLLVCGGVFLAAYALPLLLAPLAWARLFRWRLPEETDLAIYFGRCLGGVASVICAACFVAAPEPGRYRILFDMLAAIASAMVGVHGWGAVRRVQPWTETVEIPLYLAVAVAALVFRP